MARPRVYRAEALVLRGANFGEADRLLTLLTRQHGKVRAIARGVRRPTSRKGGHLELFQHVELLLATGRELDVVTQSTVRQPFRGVREDLERTAQACHLMELLDRLLQDRQPSPESFALAVAALQALDGGGDPELLVCQFQLHLFSASGFGPQLFACVTCGASLEPEGHAFSGASGGVLCPACALAEPLATRLSLGGLKLLRHLRRTPIAESGPLRVPETVRGEAVHTLRAYVERVLERRLRSPDVIARLGVGEGRDTQGLVRT